MKKKCLIIIKIKARKILAYNHFFKWIISLCLEIPKSRHRASSCDWLYLFSVSSSFLRRFASSRRLCNKAIFSLSEPSWLIFNILFSCWRRISFSLNEKNKSWLSSPLRHCMTWSSYIKLEYQYTGYKWETKSLQLAQRLCKCKGYHV